MSYDLTIAKDRSFSASARFSELADFLKATEGVKPNGRRGFVYEPSTHRYMEIDLEVVSAEGDSVEQHGRDGPDINCVRLHIPHAMLGGTPERDYFPLAFTIAERLAWTVYDDQRDEAIARGQMSREAQRGKPWWRVFW